MSYLTQSHDELLEAVISGLEGEGYAFNRLTTELPVYLATCLGDANAWKTKSVSQMLAELNSHFSGSTVSHLTMGFTQLLDTFNATLSGGSGGDGDYQGPLDVIAGAVAAYSARALSSAMRGQPLFRLRRDSDDAEMTFSSDAVTGLAPVSDILAWLGGASGYVKSWFDQSGNGKNLIKAEMDTQPQWVANGPNGHPSILSDPTVIVGMGLASESEITWDGDGVTTFLVFNNIPFDQGGTAGEQVIFAAQGNDPDATGDINIRLKAAVAHIYGEDDLSVYSYCDDYGNSNGAGFLTPVATPGLADGDFKLLDVVLATGLNSAFLNGVDLSPSNDSDYGSPPPVGAMTSTLEIPETSPPTTSLALQNCFSGTFAEIISYDAVLGPNRVLVRQNIADSHGITLA